MELSLLGESLGGTGVVEARLSVLVASSSFYFSVLRGFLLWVFSFPEKSWKGSEVVEVFVWWHDMVFVG